LPLKSLLIEEFEDHGRERERKGAEAGVLFNQRKNAVAVFVKAMSITSVWLSISGLSFQRIYGFCQGQSSIVR